MKPAFQDSRRLVADCREHAKVSIGRPSVVVLPKGRTVVSCDLSGPGLKTLPGKKGKDLVTHHLTQGRVSISDDAGETWTAAADYPFGHARLFRDGPALYALGHAGNLRIVRSGDGGGKWSKPTELTTSVGSHNRFVAGPANVLIDEDKGLIHAGLTVLADAGVKGLRASVHAQILGTAPLSVVDKPGNWRFSPGESAFRDLVPPEAGAGFGIPFHDVPAPDRGIDLGGRRWANRIGWNECHVVRLRDPDHAWHGEGVLHLLASAYTHRADFAALLRVDPDGRVGVQTAPSGAPVVFLPLPGGHRKFDLFWDEPSGRHWLVSNRGEDSMRRLDRLGRDRAGLAADECHTLALHHSTNLVDWIPACAIAREDCLHEPAAAVRGDDLVVVARAGAPDPGHPHNTQEIVQYTVARFRDFV